MSTMPVIVIPLKVITSAAAEPTMWTLAKPFPLTCSVVATVRNRSTTLIPALTTFSPEMRNSGFGPDIRTPGATLRHTLEVVENLQELEDEGEVYESIEDIWPDYPSQEDFLFNEDEY